MSSAVTCLPEETVTKPGSPATLTRTLASVRWRLVRTRAKVVVLVTEKAFLPECATVTPPRETVVATGQPFGTATDHVKVVARLVRTSQRYIAHAFIHKSNDANLPIGPASSAKTVAIPAIPSLSAEASRLLGVARRTGKSSVIPIDAARVSVPDAAN